jgi:hypothetical protein
MMAILLLMNLQLMERAAAVRVDRVLRLAGPFSPDFLEFNGRGLFPLSQTYRLYRRMMRGE